MTKDWTPNFRDHFQMSNMLKHIMGRLWAPMEVQRLGLRFVEDFQVTGLTGEGVTTGMARDSLHVEEKDVQSCWLAELHDGTGWADTHRTHCRPSFSDMTLEHLPPCWLKLGHSQPCHVIWRREIHQVPVCRSEVERIYAQVLRQAQAGWGRFGMLHLAREIRWNSYVVYVALTYMLT